MLDIRRSHQRGNANHGWLRSRHTFSFGHYHDAQQQGFSDLLVINDDRVAEDNALAIAAAGVDFVSVGALTKHIHAVDFSMRLGDPP